MERTATNKVEAIIMPYALDSVRDALLLAGIERMNVCEVKALNPRRHQGWHRGTEYVVWYEPLIKIELLVDDDRVDDSIEVIKASARTDERAVEIMVLPVNHVISIRTDENAWPVRVV